MAMNGQDDRSTSSSVWASTVKVLATAHPPRRKPKGPRLRQLEIDICDIGRRNPQGSHACRLAQRYGTFGSN
jgi:hypothetical protein